MQNEEKHEATANPQNTDTKVNMPPDNPLSAASTNEDKEDKTIHAVEGAKEASSPKHSVFHWSQMGIILRRDVYKLAKRWMQVLAIIVNTIFAGVISVIVGLGTWAPDDPIFTLVRSHPIASVVIVGLFALISILAWLISRGPAPQENETLHAPGYPRRLVFATITSTTSSVFLFALLAVVLIRPSWCPTSICQTPFNSNNPHDDHLEVPMEILQNNWYVIPGNPANYSLRNLPPKSIGAQPIDGPKSSLAFGILCEIRNWQQGGYDVVIEKLNLVIDKVPPMPYPLYVWPNPLSRQYSYYPFQVMYSGQMPGAVLPASYSDRPSNQIALSSGESNTLLVQVISNVAVDLQFHLQVIYHVPKESQLHTLTLTNPFELVFSYEQGRNKNWHPYQLLPNKGFVPSS